MQLFTKQKIEKQLQNWNFASRIANLIEHFQLTENWVWLNQTKFSKKKEKITLNCLYVYYHTFCDDFSQEESAEEIIPTAGDVQFLSY